MRNSFSLSVCFLLVFWCDVLVIVIKKISASVKMKLISLIFLSISAAVNVNSNEHFTYPPQFHPHGSGVMSPDRTVYLPPESHTSMPYFPMKNVNLPFPYLPSTVTKAPNYFSTPFPLIMSTTRLSIDNDDDRDDDDDKPSRQIQNNNRTQINSQLTVEKRELRPRQMTYQPIDRIDMKLPLGFAANHNQENVQRATPRSMIISVPDNQKNDIFDQFKSAGSQGPSYIAAPNIPGVYLSSTTETAVPIIRLSNEMDLDGSFSYEALGADQTHYVQHSRVDNFGNEKQEQVVEGSYSYVGDNGQTYTVNYIADSNGFRATGDHLPVAPPIPEIIQRSIQYNLAEEAKKPPHMKSWNEENELSESEKYQRYAISPPRNLFTGKTPESFSFAFSQGAQNTQNNLVPAASNQAPIKTNVDFTMEQMKGKTNNGISPQITFLASQGAHAPSANPQQTIQTIGRPLFSTERSTMPQLINYEAGIKDSDESNKALWRWQYGLNANINRENSEKNSISRSFGEGDDVMINFSDMTPNQYTSMIQSQLGSNNGSPQNDQSTSANEPMRNNYQKQDHHEQTNNVFPLPQYAISSTENYYDVTSQAVNWNKHENQYDSSPKLNQQMSEISNENFAKSRSNNQNNNVNTHYVPDMRTKLITNDKLIPSSLTVTHSYNYEDMVYEPQRIKPSTLEPLTKSALGVFDSESKDNSYDRAITQNVLWSKADPVQVSSTIVAPTATSTESFIKFANFLDNEKIDELRPVYKPDLVIKQNDVTTTTDESNEDILRDNIFLRNLFKSEHTEPVSNKLKTEKKVNIQTKNLTIPKTEFKNEKSPKFIPVKPKPFNEVQPMKNKPLIHNMADIMNFISLKNHFESAKTKPKSAFRQDNNYQKSEMRFIPVQENHYQGDNEEIEQSSSALRTNYYQPEEVRGNIKNYKVLQRNNNANIQEADQLKRELSPPPIQTASSNLPPLGRAGPSMKSYLPPIYV